MNLAQQLITEPLGSNGEEAAKRTQNSKTFDMGDGQRRLIVSQSPIHYESSPGNWSEIDTTVVKNGAVYQVLTAPFDVSIPTDAVGYDYTSKRGGMVSIRLLELDDSPLPSLNITPRIEDNELWLDDVVPGLDINIKVKPAKVEIWKIVKNALGPLVFKWQVVSDNELNNFTIQTDTKGFDNLDNLDHTVLRPDDTKAHRRLEILSTIGPEIIPGSFTIREEITTRTIKKGLTRIKSFEEGKMIYPLLIDQDITENIQQASDDGFEENDTTWFNDYGGDIYVGMYDAKDEDAGFRFQTVAIPQAATIDDATLILEVSVNTGGADVRFYGDDVDDAPTWGSSDRPSQTAGSRTTAFTDWANSTTGSRSIDVTSIIQEIINRGGWVTGNDLRLLTENLAVTPPQEELNQVDAYGGGGTPASLEINYTAGGGALVTGSASISGLGDLNSVGLNRAFGFGGLVGAGAIGSDAFVQINADGSIANVGVLIVNSFLEIGGNANIAGSGILTVDGTLTTFGAANLSGVGALVAIGDISSIVSGLASLVGVGALATDATVQILGDGTLANAGLLTVEGLVQVLAEANLTGAGALIAIGTISTGLVTAIASLTGAGALATDAFVQINADGTLANAGILTVEGLVQILADGTIAGLGILIASGTISGEVAAVAIITPDGRTYLIAVQDRIYNVPIQDRVYEVPLQSRIYEVTNVD